MIPPRHRDRSSPRYDTPHPAPATASRKRPLSHPDDLSRVLRRPRHSPPLFRNILDRHVQPLKFATFSSTGHFLVTSGKDTSVCLWHANPRADEPLDCFRVISHPQPVFQAFISDNAGHAITSCADGSIRLWQLDPYNDPKVNEFHRSSFRRARACQITPDGAFALATFYSGRRTNIRGATFLSSFSSSVVLLDHSGRVIFEVEQPGKVDICRMSHDASVLAVGLSGVTPRPKMAAGNRILIMTSKGRVIRSFDDCFRQEQLCQKWDLSHSGSHLALVSDDQQSIRVFESGPHGLWNQRPIILSCADVTPYHLLRFADHAKQMVIAIVGSGYYPKTIRVFDVEAQSVLFEVPAASGDCLPVAIEPRIGLVSTSSGDYEEVRTICKETSDATKAIMFTSRHEIRSRSPAYDDGSRVCSLTYRPAAHQRPHCRSDTGYVGGRDSYRRSPSQRRKPEQGTRPYGTPERSLRLHATCADRPKDFGVPLERGRRKRRSCSPRPRNDNVTTTTDPTSPRMDVLTTPTRHRSPATADGGHGVDNGKIPDSRGRFESNVNRSKSVANCLSRGTTVPSEPKKECALVGDQLRKSKRTSTSRHSFENVSRTSTVEQASVLEHPTQPVRRSQLKDTVALEAAPREGALQVCEPLPAPLPVKRKSAETEYVDSTVPKPNGAGTDCLHPSGMDRRKSELECVECNSEKSKCAEPRTSKKDRAASRPSERRDRISAEEEPNGVVHDLVGPRESEPGCLEHSTTESEGAEPRMSKEDRAASRPSERRDRESTDEEPNGLVSDGVEPRESEPECFEHSITKSKGAEPRTSKEHRAVQKPSELRDGPSVGEEPNEVVRDAVEPLASKTFSTGRLEHSKMDSSGAEPTTSGQNETGRKPSESVKGQPASEEQKQLVCKSGEAVTAKAVGAECLELNRIESIAEQRILREDERVPKPSESCNRGEEPHRQVRDAGEPLVAKKFGAEPVDAEANRVDVCRLEQTALCAADIDTAEPHVMVKPRETEPVLGPQPSPASSTRLSPQLSPRFGEGAKIEVTDGPAARTRLSTRKISFLSTRDATRSTGSLVRKSSCVSNSGVVAPVTDPFEREGSPDDNIPIAQLRRKGVAKRRKQTRTRRCRGSVSTRITRSRVAAKEDESSPSASTPPDDGKHQQHSPEPGQVPLCPNLQPPSLNVMVGPCGKQSGATVAENCGPDVSATGKAAGEQLMLVGTSLISSSMNMGSNRSFMLRELPVMQTSIEGIYEEECIDGGFGVDEEDLEKATVKNESAAVQLLPPPPTALPVVSAPNVQHSIKSPEAVPSRLNQSVAVKVEQETVDVANSGPQALVRGIEEKARFAFHKASDRVTVSGLRCLTGAQAFRTMKELVGSELGWVGDREVAHVVYGKTGTSNVCTEGMFLQSFYELLCCIQLLRRQRWEKLFRESLPEKEEALLVFHARDLLKQDSPGKDFGSAPSWTDEEMDEVFETEGAGMLVNLEAFLRAAERIVCGKPNAGEGFRRDPRSSRV